MISATLGFSKVLWKQLPERAAALHNYATYAAAQYALASVKSKIPSEYATYRDSLKIFQVDGGAARYIITIDPEARNVTKVDMAKTLYFVRPKKKAKRTSDLAKLLDKYGPWTTDTLPIRPDRKDAYLISRLVSSREVDKRTKELEQTRGTWQPEFARIGCKGPNKKKKLPRLTGKQPDVLLDALSLEYGIGGKKSKPHWGPTLNELRGGAGVAEFMKSKTAYRYIHDVTFTDWQAGNPTIAATLSLSDTPKDD